MTGMTGTFLAAMFALVLITGCGRYGPLIRKVATEAPAPTAGAEQSAPPSETVPPEGVFQEGDDEE